MGFLSSLTEKIGSAFASPEVKATKAAKKILAFRENAPLHQTDTLDARRATADVVSIDHSQRTAEGVKTSRQESARLLNEIFAEVKKIDTHRRVLNESRWGAGLGGELWKELKTTVHGNVIHCILLGEAAFATHQAVQSELFSQILGPATGPAAVIVTALIARESIKKISEVTDYYFRGGRSQRKLLEQERQKISHLKKERKLVACHYKEGSMSAEEYIHYAADLARNVRMAEETVLNGRPKNDGTANESQFPAKKTKEILGEKKLVEQERGRAMARSIAATVAAPIVGVLNGMPLGINEWDGITPAHPVVASLQGVRYYSDGIARALSPIPHQTLTAFAAGATALIGKAIHEIRSLHNTFKPESLANTALQSMESSIERIKKYQEDLQTIANATPRPGRNLNVGNIEALRRRPPQQAALHDFSELAANVEVNIAKDAARKARKAARAAAPTLMDTIIGKITRPIKPAPETTPFTSQDFGESPSLFRAEAARKAFGASVAPGTLLDQNGFMDHLERRLEGATDIDVINLELYFSDQQHRHSKLDVSDSVIATLDDASRRCAAERLKRIAEKMPIVKSDPNALRARLLTLIGMDDEIAVGQKYFEKLFAQGYANASRIQRAYFNKVISALDLSLNVNEVTRMREKNAIFESVRVAIERYDQSQSQAA